MEDILPQLVEGNEERQLEQLEDELPGLASYVWGKFEDAENSRLEDEARWTRNFQDYLGTYTFKFRENEESRVFVKIPKTKTLAAYGQLIEVVFASHKFPISIKPTEKPEGIAEKAHLDEGGGGPVDSMESAMDPSMDFGFPGDGFETARDRVLGGLAAKYEGGSGKFVAGPSLTPNNPTISPAEETARNMEKTIHDQLTETSAARELRSSLFGACLYGTGILKGPFTEDKVMHRWEILEKIDDAGKKTSSKSYKPGTVPVPRIKDVSVWNAYPDPSATNIEECEYFIERHKMNRSELRALMKQPLFNKEAIANCLRAGPNWTKRGYESQVLDDNSEQFIEQRWEVLEFWGVVDVDFLRSVGYDVDGTDDPDEADVLDEAQVNIWVCGSEILRVVMNPFEPQRIPYHVFPYEKRPHRFFGSGVPENMSDSTIIMNGHLRMAIDNLKYAGNLVFDIDEDALVPGSDLSVYPGKVFRRQSGSQPGQAVFGIKFPNTANENMMIFDKFREISDQETGIPSYSHGATGVQSTTRTAAGMSMLMGAAALNIKTIVKNLDDYLLKPLGETLYYWNMQFNSDLTVKGDMDVKATGTDAVMQKEVRSQRLTQFLQVAANPAIIPFIKPHKIIKELAISLDLDPEDVVNDVDQAMIYARIIGAAGGLGGEEPGLDTGPTGTGDATIGTGGAAQPGEDEFSGRPMPQGSQAEGANAGTA